MLQSVDFGSWLGFDVPQAAIERSRTLGEGFLGVDTNTSP